MTTLDRRREAVIREAESWIGTPFHHAARIKGAGVDCLMLLAEIYERAGVVPHIDPPFYVPDWHLHRDAERYLEGLAATPVRSPAVPSPAISRCSALAAPIRTARLLSAGRALCMPIGRSALFMAMRVCTRLPAVPSASSPRSDGYINNPRPSRRARLAPDAPQDDGHFLEGIKDLPHPEERSTGARLEGRTAPIQRSLHPSVRARRALSRP